MKQILITLIAGLALVAAHPMHIWEDNRHASSHSRAKRQTQEQEERNCDVTPPTYPDTTKFTTEKLDRLRAEMKRKDLDAYIIPSEDAHGSEYIAERDKRREYISGFSGSAGLAVVTRSKNAENDLAAVWVDGRYFLQAKMELDCNWLSMESGEINIPTLQEWLVCEDEDLCSRLPDNARVGVDPLLISATDYLLYQQAFDEASKSVTMVSIKDNLIDIVWRALDEQPIYPGEELLVLGTEHTGRSWQAKIFYDDPEDDSQTIRQVLKEKKAKALVINKLDEVAWIFNLRGEDVPYNPMFIAYAIISLDWIRLYMYDATQRLDYQRYPEVREHLELGQCSGTKDCISIRGYEDFIDDLTNLGQTSKVWFSETASFAIYEAVAAQNRIMEPSPILLMKAVKNRVEREGMRSACIKDSISICELASWIQERVDQLQDKVNGDIQFLSELKVREQSIFYREEMWGLEFRDLSFETISAFGEHAAVIHYNATIATNVPITTTGTYLLDTGAHYKDGTTDITRTFHYGNPTKFMKEAYTRVLMGHIDLAQAVFRTGTYGRDLDSIARQPLWAGGLDYRHGTGHGIGHFLNVHEDPINIGTYAGEEQLQVGVVVSDGNQGTKTKCFDSDGDKPVQIGAFLSDEPGYYEDGSFGIRIENDVETVMADTDHSFSTYTYMTFNVISLVPFEPYLIDFSMLSRKQIDWYNEYNERILKEIYPHPELSQRAREWIKDKTYVVTYQYTYNRAASTSSGILFTAIIALISTLMQ